MEHTQVDEFRLHGDVLVGVKEKTTEASEEDKSRLARALHEGGLGNDMVVKVVAAAACKEPTRSTGKKFGNSIEAVDRSGLAKEVPMSNEIDNLLGVRIPLGHDRPRRVVRGALAVSLFPIGATSM